MGPLERELREHMKQITALNPGLLDKQVFGTDADAYTVIRFQGELIRGLANCVFRVAREVDELRAA